MEIQYILKNAFDFCRKILFPPKCIFCGKILEPNIKIRVCGTCGDDIVFCSDSLTCEKCGKPIVGYADKKLCYFCINSKIKRFDRIVSVFSYEDSVKDAVIRFKADGFLGYAETFADCIAAKVREEYSGINFDYILSVLPHSKSKKKDAVALLSKCISKRLEIPYKQKVFEKVRKTRKQSGLNIKERFENINESIKVKTDIGLMGTTVLLIDDVCTTRSTITEYSRALKKAGAKKVYAATIATVKNYIKK